ncbi:MAG: hypothetical protein V1743_01665 [Nanoarchaeota archaeon]
MTLILSLFLFSCSQTGTNTVKDNSKFFTGYDGVNIKLSPGTVPSKVYYYGRNPGPQDNIMNFNLELTNTGSADSYGGAYISGYDPSFIDVTGVNINEIGGWGDCDFDLLYLGGNWLGYVSCLLWGNDISLTLGSNGNLIKGGSADVDVGQVFQTLTGKDWLNGLRGQINCDTTRQGGCRFGLDYQGSDFDFGYQNNGRGAIGYITTIYQDLYGSSFINTAHGKEFALLGDRQTFPGGDLDYIDFQATIQNWPRGLEQTEQKFLFTSCYVYTTYADPQVCIDPFPESLGRKICKPKVTTYPKGQGAPVAITKIEQENTPRSIFFTIYVENKGKGMLYHPTSLHKCDPLNAERVTQKDLNFVFLGDIRLANDWEQIRCQPANRLIKLENGKGQIVCEYQIKYGIKSAYLSPLVISLWYGYSSTVEKTVLIRRGD